MIQLNYRDSKPIYEQVKDSIRRLVVLGALAPGEKLPSVRELASTLAINPNTIAKAYRELEAEGYLFTENGRGTFVAEEREELVARRAVLLGKLDEVVSELLYLRVEPQTILERVEELEKEKKHD